MSGFRPITDVWILGRPKVKYFGAYPSGFLERARSLLGVSIHDPVLHVCGGRVRDYPFRGFGPNDRTVDLDPGLDPDFTFDVRRIGNESGLVCPLNRSGSLRPIAVHVGVPKSAEERTSLIQGGVGYSSDPVKSQDLWPAVLTDPPYSEAEAQNYSHAKKSYPARGRLLKGCLQVVRPGGRVGFLDRQAPRPPKHGVRLVAMVAVIVGFGNDARIFSVYEREVEELASASRARARKAIRGK